MASAKRTITVSGLLQDYLDWPGVAQVFKLAIQGFQNFAQARRSFDACPRKALSILVDAQRFQHLAHSEAARLRQQASVGMSVRA